MKILTFNHHESFLSAIARTGYQFDVVEEKGSLDLHWNPASPPRPQNVNPVTFDSSLKKRLRDGYYDVVLCHTIKNLLWMFPYRKARFIFVAHIHLFSESPLQRLKAVVKKAVYRVFAAIHSCRFVAVTEDKINSWNLPGKVIVNVPVNRIPVTRSEEVQQVIFVSNEMKRRGDEAGYSVISQLKKKVPLTVIGRNPGLSYGITPRDHSHFCHLFGQGRIYVFPVKPPFDEFNLALLEAMNMGIPVVCLHHPLSPIQHNENGLVAESVDEMATYIEFLLCNGEERKRLGENARKTIEVNFSSEEFVKKWQKSISDH